MNHDPNFDRQMAVRLVTSLTENYQSHQKNSFLGAIADMLLDRCSTVQKAQEIVNKIPLEFKQFPSLAELNAFLPKKKTRPPVKELPEQMWVSKQAPGTPARLEALLQTVHNGGDTNSGAFRYGLQYCGISEAELMDCYEQWIEGKVPRGFENEQGVRPFVLRKNVP